MEPMRLAAQVLRPQHPEHFFKAAQGALAAAPGLPTQLHTLAEDNPKSQVLPTFPPAVVVVADTTAAEAAEAAPPAVAPADLAAAAAEASSIHRLSLVYNS